MNTARKLVAVAAMAMMTTFAATAHAANCQ